MAKAFKNKLKKSALREHPYTTAMKVRISDLIIDAQATGWTPKGQNKA
jgi:hypothetical protein